MRKNGEKVAYRWECSADRGSGLDRETCNCKGRWTTLASAIRGGQAHNERHGESLGCLPRVHDCMEVSVYRRTPSGQVKLEIPYDRLNDMPKPGGRRPERANQPRRPGKRSGPMMNKSQAFAEAKAAYPRLKPTIASGFCVANGVLLITGHDEKEPVVVAVYGKDLERLSTMANLAMGGGRPARARRVKASVGLG